MLRKTLLILGALLLWCGHAAHAETVNITFWHAMRGDKEATLKQLVADFEQSHPEVHVEARFVGTAVPYGSDYSALYRALLEGLARHQPPDVSQVYENWTTELIDYGYLVPVAAYFNQAEDGFAASDLADLIPTFREANTYGGQMWTLPFNKSIYVLYCNQNMLHAAHVTPPTTWEALRAASRKLNVGGHFGMVVQPNVDALGHWLYAYNSDFVVGNQVAFNGDVGVAGLQYWVDLINRDRSARSSFDAGGEFIAGKAAMYIYTTSSYANINRSANFHVWVAPLPAAPGKSRRVMFAGTNLALFKSTPQRQLAAWKFIRYLTSRGVNTRWALHTGYLPVRQSAIESKDYQSFLAKHPDYRAAAVDALRFARVQSRLAAWESIRGIIDDAMYDAISGRLTPKDALSHAGTLSTDLMRKLGGSKQ